jgi:hypothetical protein
MNVIIMVTHVPKRIEKTQYVTTLTSLKVIKMDKTTDKKLKIAGTR